MGNLSYSGIKPGEREMGPGGCMSSCKTYLGNLSFQFREKCIGQRGGGQDPFFILQSPRGAGETLVQHCDKREEERRGDDKRGSTSIVDDATFS